MLAGVLLLSGCGSDNISDTPTQEEAGSAVEINGGEIVVSDTNFTLSMALVKQLDSSYTVAFSDFDLLLEGCSLKNVIFSPSTVTLDGRLGSAQTLRVSGDFETKCLAKKYQIYSTRRVTKGTQVQEDSISIAYETQTNDITATPTNGFLNATTPLQVTQPSQEQEIKVQLVKNGDIATAQEVKLLPFDSQYGGVSSYTTTTQADGYATFNYTAPSTLPADGTSTLLTLTHKDDTNTTITQNIVLTFNRASLVDENLDTQGMTLYAVPNEILIQNQGETRTLNLYLSKSNLPVTDTNITANFLNPNNGTLNSYNLATDINGQVLFNYTAPDNLPLNAFDITFQVQNGTPKLSQNVNVKFGSSTGVSEYKLEAPTIPIIIDSIEEREIAVQVIKDGTPQVGAIVTAKSFPSAFGSFRSVNVTTGEDGYARFTYVPADPLQNGDVPLSFYFDDPESGRRISTSVTILISKKAASLPTIVIPNDSLSNTLTVNSQLVTIDIKVFAANTNSPYSEGTVKVELPQKVLDGVDIGSFVSYEVNITNGVATFEYTGPNDLQGLVDSGDSGSTFSFYHIDNSTDKKEVVMVYEPDEDNGYIPVNYELTVGSEDGEFTMGLVQEKTFNVVLKDDQGTQVPDANITSITIESKNSFIGKLLDNGTEKDKLTHTGTNPVNFSVRTNTKSGLLPIDIVVKFSDANNNPQELNQTINIVVYSGPPTAMSISYAGVEPDEARAKYIEKFAVTVVDTYNNKVNTQPNISVGAIVEYAVDGNRSATGERNETSPRLWYGGNDADLGSVVPIGGDEAEFNTTTNSNIFRWIDFDNDKLVVFGVGYVYEALGKWDIAPKEDNNASLELLDNYFGAQRDNLYYAVGHNNRQDLCSSDGREYVGAAKSDTYQIDSEGTALVEFEYDYHLTGKDIMLWVNLDGFQADTGTNTRIGEARKHTLRGNGLVSVPNSYIVTGRGVTVRFQIEHENAAEWYRNAKFSYAVTGSCFLEEVVRSSNESDARKCYNGGTGITYVDLNVSITTSTTCTVGIEDIVVATEFSSGRE